MFKRLDLSDKARKDLFLFLMAMALLAFSQSVFDTVFNNYLNETFKMSGFRRTFLELPREIPGLLVVFVSALFFFLSNRRLAAFSQLLTMAGAICIGFVTESYSFMLVWLLMYSAGQHIFLPLQSDIGMELAGSKGLGGRLGQIYSWVNIAGIIGSAAVFLGFRFLKLGFKASFIVAAVGFLAGAIALFAMSPNKPVPFKEKIFVRREYVLFYWLTVLYGMRKQIFLTFAPWVLVFVFKQKTWVMAVLFTIGRTISIFYTPWLGRIIDRIGEKAVLAWEAGILILVCAGYGFGRFFFDEKTAFIIAAACFVTDQLLMSVGMARATYLKKIAVKQEEVTATLTMGTSLDHVFSISIALLGGFVWDRWGYEALFVGGAVIAGINLVSVLLMRIPAPRTEPALRNG